MAIARRFSIRLLMILVFLVAADFAIVRGSWGERSVWPAVAIVTLPMINLLFLATPKLQRGNATRPYWLGFEVAGWAMILVFGLLSWSSTETFFWPLVWVDPVVSSLSRPARLAVVIPLIIVVYTTGQLLPALLAGKLSARYRVVIERR